jgi:hypothetical protein
MENNMTLIKANNGATLEQDSNTGLVVGKNYQADSGFEYIFGLRKFGDLTIAESVGRGTAVSYLNAVRVLNEKGELIIDKEVEKGTHYSRETARQIVMSALLNMLEEAARKQGKEYNREKASILINDKLKLAYYEKSYASVLDWASELGIEFE